MIKPKVGDYIQSSTYIGQIIYIDDGGLFIQWISPQVLSYYIVPIFPSTIRIIYPNDLEKAVLGL